MDSRNLLSRLSCLQFCVSIVIMHTVVLASWLDTEEEFHITQIHITQNASRLDESRCHSDQHQHSIGVLRHSLDTLAEVL